MFLQPDTFAQAHLILAEGEGVAAVIDLVDHADAEFAGQATLLYTGADLPAHLLCLTVTVFPEVASLLRESARHMDRAVMGTRIYVAGSASFIGEVAKLSMRYGVSRASLMTEQRGGAGKRVQCVHCKAMLDNVVTATVTCSACKIRLTVRAHYSHRLGAFMGVSCEAEQVR